MGRNKIIDQINSGSLSKEEIDGLTKKYPFKWLTDNIAIKQPKKKSTAKRRAV